MIALVFLLLSGLSDSDGSSLAESFALEANVQSIAFVDERTLAIADEGGRLHVWRLKAEEPVLSMEGLSGRIKLAVSRDQTKLASCNGKDVRVFGLKDGERLFEHATDVSSLAFIDGDRSVRGVSSKGVIRTWDMTDGTESATVQVQERRRIKAARIGDDGTRAIIVVDDG